MDYYATQIKCNESGNSRITTAVAAGFIGPAGIFQNLLSIAFKSVARKILQTL